MRYRMSLLLSLLIAGISVMVMPASANYVTTTYNLESVTIYGYVESVENQVAYLRIGYGDEVAVQLGPDSYWNANRYYLTRGEYVEMLVWYDPDDQYTDCYFAGEIWGPGYHYRITNDEGVPYWVIFADDYYYSIGYRASCVSFMLWYDCPPVYFVYLMLPPPPPRTYVCYYGPHWRTHHHDWHYGPRYRRGGSYWDDGQGYERHGRRSTTVAGNNSAQKASTTSEKLSVSNSNTYKRPVAPVTPPVVKPRTDLTEKSSLKTQSVANRRSVSVQKQSQSKSVTSVTTPTSKVISSKSVTQERKLRSQTKVQLKTNVGTSNKVVRQVQRDNSKSKINQVSRTLKAKNHVISDNQRKRVSK